MKSGNWACRSHRRVLTRPALPGGTLFAGAAVIAWFTILLTARANPPGGTLSAIYGVIAFAPDVLAVIAVVRFIGWLRRNRHAPPH